MKDKSLRQRMARWLDPDRGDTTNQAAQSTAYQYPATYSAGYPATYSAGNPATYSTGYPATYARGYPGAYRQTASPTAGHPPGHPGAGPTAGPFASAPLDQAADATMGAGTNYSGARPDMGWGNGAVTRGPASAVPPMRPSAGPDGRMREVWPQICERFALQMLAHAEAIRPALDHLESDEQDEDRLQWLYQVDHSVTRMRRAARDLRVLAGVEEGELGGYTSSLVDVIRAAESAIEHYPQVVIGRVVDLAVVPYAADDFAALLAALLDNATSYSPSTVTVSAHLLDSGSVMLRIEDNGIGISPAHLEVLNAALAGQVPDVNERTGKHTGFPVVHRLARKHGVNVRLASRPGAGGPGGTVAMVTIPPDLLCEVPDEDEPAFGAGEEPGENPEPKTTAYASGWQSSHLSVARPSQVEEWQPSAPAPQTGPHTIPQSGTVSGLPRRNSTSLRGDGVRVRGQSRSRDTSAAARSFAEDLTAFTSGEQAGRHRPPGAGQEQPEGEQS